MKKLKFPAAVLLAALVLRTPQASVNGMQRAVRLWYANVAPALFPFLALLPSLTGEAACAAYRALFQGIMRPIFGLPGEAAAAWAVGLLGGSPVGALAIRRMAASGALRPSEARRLALSICGVSPAFLIAGVGGGMLGSTAMGVRLALVQIAAQCLMLFLLRFAALDGEPMKLQRMEPLSQNPILGAVIALLTICGNMVFFGIIAEIAGECVGSGGRCALLLALDLPSGLAELAPLRFSGKMCALGAAIGFGGCCIAAQNMDALRSIGLRLRAFLCARVCAALLMGGLCALLLRDPTADASASRGGSEKAYAIALLAAALMLLPALRMRAHAQFLNIRHTSEKETLLAQNLQDVVEP